MHAAILRLRLIVMPTCWSTYQETYHQSRRKPTIALDDDLSEDDYTMNAGNINKKNHVRSYFLS